MPILAPDLRALEVGELSGCGWADQPMGLSESTGSVKWPGRGSCSTEAKFDGTTDCRETSLGHCRYNGPPFRALTWQRRISELDTALMD